MTNGHLERRIFTVNIGNLSIGDAENYFRLFADNLKYEKNLRNRAAHFPKTEEEKNFFNSQINYTFEV